MSIINLPTELLLMIFQMLSSNDILRLTNVCKMFYKIATSFKWNKYLEVKNIKNVPKNVVFDKVYFSGKTNLDDMKFLVDLKGISTIFFRCLYKLPDDILLEQYKKYLETCFKTLYDSGCKNILIGYYYDFDINLLPIFFDYYFYWDYPTVIESSLCERSTYTLTKQIDCLFSTDNFCSNLSRDEYYYLDHEFSQMTREYTFRKSCDEYHLQISSWLNGLYESASVEKRISYRFRTVKKTVYKKQFNNRLPKMSNHKKCMIKNRYCNRH